MSDTEIKKLAREFIDSQKKILEEHGDSIVKSKYEEAVVSAEKIFRSIVTKPKSVAATARS
jgi:hypothetical protein